MTFASKEFAAPLTSSVPSLTTSPSLGVLSCTWEFVSSTGPFASGSDAGWPSSWSVCPPLSRNCTGTRPWPYAACAV